MLFNSISFIVFFPLVLLICFVIPKRFRYIWLLFSSYYFYMSWNTKYGLLLVGVTFVTYGGALIVEKKRKKNQCMKAKIAVGSCVVLNLSVLIFFKYLDFFSKSISELLATIGIQIVPKAFDIVLPIGISFYVFQSLGYVVDVYRGEIYAEKNFLRYALFVSFFPQLVAGPIERSKNLLKRLAKPIEFEFENFRDGIFLMLWGYFLKLVLADRISIFVDEVYGNWHIYSGYYLIVATGLFAFQIYCDFAGYSTIAMGAARILGVTLTDNFDAPYISSSISSFWRKWHISLTTWFRDYLYIPMGGNRRRANLNKLIVFLASGLWHGADFSYVVWGGLNGVYLVIEGKIKRILPRLDKVFHVNHQKACNRMLRGIFVFAMVDLSWIFFRASSVQEAIDIIKQILVANNRWILFDGSLYKCGLDIAEFWVMIIAIIVLLVADWFKHKGIIIRELIKQQDGWFRYLFIALSIAVIMTFGKYGPAYDPASFIYFQF